MGAFRLQAEQRFLGVEPPAKARQVTGAANDTVARDDNGQRITAVRRADRTDGLRVPDPLCDFPVAHRFAVRNILQRAQHADLELGTGQFYGQVEFTPLAYETVFQTMADPVVVVDEQGRIIGLNHGAESLLDINETAALLQPLTNFFGEESPEVSEAIIGLAEVRETIEGQLGGSLSAGEPAQGWGAVFAVDLPLASMTGDRGRGA